MNNTTTNAACKHGEYFTCKRLRMLEHLRNEGYLPIKTIPDANNPKFNNWIFENSPRFEEVVSSYFEQQRNRK